MTSTSQRVLRATIAVASVALAALTTLTAPGGSLVLALILVGLTPFVVLDPATRLGTLLLAGHAVNWLDSVPVPEEPGNWLPVLAAAVLLATIHLAAALSSAFPASADVPGATVRRWARRSAGVLALSLPVWLLLVAQSAAAPEGDPLLTYAALAAVGLLALGFWQAATRSRTSAPSTSTTPSSSR